MTLHSLNHLLEQCDIGLYDFKKVRIRQL